MGYESKERQIDIGDRRKTSFPAGLIHDLMVAGRLVLRRPGFALIVVATLAVGIGPTVVVDFPSPSGVGVTAVTSTYLPMGRSDNFSRMSRWTFALFCP